jgi:hypothetical protein
MAIINLYENSSKRIYRCYDGMNSSHFLSPCEAGAKGVRLKRKVIDMDYLDLY